MALFPELVPPAGCVAQRRTDVMHVFSGSLPESSNYIRCDVRQDAELVSSVYDLPQVMLNGCLPLPRLIIADPPYTKADAEKYGTPMVDRRRAMQSLAAITTSGAYLAWLDTVWPMHSKREWVTVGRILVQRSTNHRVRLLSLFERV